MNDSALFDQIVTKMRLQSELTQALVCLEEYLSNFFTPKNQTDLVALFNQLPNGLAELFKEAFLKEKISPENQNILKKRIDVLAKKLRACKTVQLTLAFKPDEGAIAQFSDWVKKNVGPETLIDLQFDKSIIGGAQLIANGLYKDYSIRKTLAGKFQIQREEITGMLKENV